MMMLDDVFREHILPRLHPVDAMLLSMTCRDYARTAARENTVRVDWLAVERMAAAGSLSLLLAIRERFPTACPGRDRLKISWQQVAVYAAEISSLPLLQAIRGKLGPSNYDPDTVRAWLDRNRCPPWVACSKFVSRRNRPVSLALATAGNMKIIRWARRAGCPWDYACSVVAARNGHIHVLQSTRNIHSLPWSVYTAAAEGGHTHILRWFAESGYRGISPMSP